MWKVSQINQCLGTVAKMVDLLKIRVDWYDRWISGLAHVSPTVKPWLIFGFVRFFFFKVATTLVDLLFIELVSHLLHVKQMYSVHLLGLHAPTMEHSFGFCQQHLKFPSGLTSKYYPGPMLLNLSVSVRFFVCWDANPWPPSRITHKTARICHLSMSKSGLSTLISSSSIQFLRPQ